jgi:murein L,D-transpeptidase YcbB/YkuD
MTFTFTTSGPEKVKMKKSRSLPFMYPLAVLLALWVNAANAAGQDASDAIREHVERHQLSRQLALAGADIAGLDVFWRLYENNNYAPLWPEQERIDVLIDMVGRAEEEGLLPRDYHHETLLRLRRSNPRKAEDVADFDMLLTDSLMRYLYHRYFGKVGPPGTDSRYDGRRGHAATHRGSTRLGPLLPADETTAGGLPGAGSERRRGLSSRTVRPDIAQGHA